MQTLEERAVATFKQNIQYFEQNQKNVFDKLAALDSAVEQNLYQNRYELIIENGYFEVIELSSGEKLYNSNSYEYAKSVRDSVNLKKSDNVFKTFKTIPLDKDYEHFIDLTPTLRYIEKNLANNSEFKRIEKFIFFGVGLGSHISSVADKLKCSSYLIVEDDLELFRLSLFVTPYYELASTSRVVFSIFESSQEFSSSSQIFINHNFYQNHYIKFFHMLSHNEEKIKEFHINVVSQSKNIFFYKDILTQYLKPLEYMRNNYNFLNMLHSYENSSITDKPLLLLAAGPSLQKNIEWIKENQKKFLVVALSSVLSTLEKENITPDIVTHMDGFESSAVHFSKLKSLDFLSKTIFFLSARTPDSVVKILEKSHIFFYENGTSYKQNIGNLSAACVGSTTYLLLLALGAKELYLLGLDLAIDEKTGSTHSDGHEYAKELDLETSDRHDDILEFKKSVVKVAGNFEDEVYTTPEYRLSIESINVTSQGFKKEYQHVYNLNNGAKFLNTTPKKTDTINVEMFDTIDKDILASELKDIFTSSCSRETTKDEILQLQQKVEYASQLKDIILSQQNYYFDSSEEFLNSLWHLFLKLSQNDSATAYDLSLIIQEYCKFIYTFIFDFFNTKGVTDRHCQNINLILTKALRRIIDEYLQALTLTCFTASI